MKTKHLYISVMLATLFLASNTTTQAQTKDETISWIKEKFIKYADYMGSGWSANVVSLDINPCEIIFVYKYTHTDESFISKKKKLPVLSQTIIKNGSFGKNIPIIEIWPDNEASLIHYIVEVGNKKRINDKRISEGYNESQYLRNGEPDLAERMQKALRHLATFCEKKKETF